MQRSCVVRKLSSVSDDNVVKLEVVVKEPRLMDELDGFEKLDADLKGGLLAEGLISLEEIVLECSSEFVLDNVRPNFSLKFSDHLFLIILRFLGRFLLFSYE